MQINTKRLLHVLLIQIFLFSNICFAEVVSIVDDAGKTLQFESIPQRVVSLVPSATEIIFGIGGGDSVAGITLHSSSLKGAAAKPVVGGFMAPSPQRIAALEPDLIIASTMHSEIMADLEQLCPVMVISTKKMEDAFRHISMMGKIFHLQERATLLVLENKEQLTLIAEKVAKIPDEKRKRVMRFMGGSKVMTPGSDSFQNEIIRAAGGIAPDFGRSGQVVPVTKEQFTEFNPQFIYGCGQFRKSADELLQSEGWSEVDAVKNHSIHSFPCILTCRASTHLGYFVSWLSSLIYQEEFADSANEVLKREIVEKKAVPIDLDFVKTAAVTTEIVHDFPNRSLIVDFASPRTVVSTLDGQRDNISTVGNHYSPPPCWALNHASGLEELKKKILPVLERDIDTSTFLFTGADMNNLAVVKEQYKDMIVYGLITAGVRGNAQRMSKDIGMYYEPGTINMIFLSNMHLTERAMTRAIISATEGKTAALQDLAIRSSYQPLTAGATGTGTDNIIVVQGDGQRIDGAGGHTKMGELIAKAAYKGVKEAIEKQNRIIGDRNIFERLRDYHVSVRGLVSRASAIEPAMKKECGTQLEQLLLDHEASGFLAAAFEVSDGYVRGNIEDLYLFSAWCRGIASGIGGRELEVIHYIEDDTMPEPMKMAFNAMLTGIVSRIEDGGE